MRFRCAILVGAVEQPRMRGDPVTFEENLNRIRSERHIDLLPDVPIRNRVVLLVYRNVVVVLDCRHGCPLFSGTACG